MKRRFVYKRDYSFAYNGNINFVLKILTNAALSEGRHSILVPCFFFFSLPKRLPAAALQGWNSFGEVVGKRMKRVLFRGKWSMVFENECTFSREYRQEMLYCGLYLKCSHAVHHCWRGEREGRRESSRVVQGQYPSIDASFPVTFVRFLFFFSPSTGWRIEQDVLGESRPEMIRLKYSLKLQFSAEFMYPVLEERFMERIEGGETNIA